MKRFFTALLATAVLVIPMLAPGASAGRDALDGTSWVLDSITGTSLLPDLQVTLGFEDGRLQGTDGCNRYGAPYAADAKGFRLTGPLVSTKKACPGPVMQRAQAFLEALEQAREARIEGEGKRLILSDATGKVLATLAMQSRDLAGTAWEVTGYNNGRQAVVSVRSGSTLTIAFSGDGKVSGSAGCNRYTGGYSVSGGTISIGSLAATRRMCGEPDGVMEQEAQFLKALERIEAVQREGDRLELRGGDGALQVSAKGGPDRNAPTDLSRPLGGEMQYMADAAVLTECITGRRYPIAMEADYLGLERAYLAAVREPGAPLYVTLEGDIVQRPKMEGEGTQATVVVRRFINVWPQQKCERARAHASLTNTYWRIVRLGDEAVTAAPDRREPHLILRAGSETGRYSATVGCNQLLGGYEVEGEAILMKPAAATLMACPEPLAATETKLSQVLESAKRWRLNANTLEFFDESGSPIALFEAVHL